MKVIAMSLSKILWPTLINLHQIQIIVLWPTLINLHQIQIIVLLYP